MFSLVISQIGYAPYRKILNGNCWFIAKLLTGVMLSVLCVLLISQIYKSESVKNTFTAAMDKMNTVKYYDLNY